MKIHRRRFTLVDTVHLERPPGEKFKVQEDVRNVIAVASQINQSASARGYGNGQFRVLNTWRERTYPGRFHASRETYYFYYSSGSLANPDDDRDRVTSLEIENSRELRIAVEKSLEKGVKTLTN